MPTTNPRINITFNHDTVNVLAILAKQEHRSLANLAKELILEALDRREDLALTHLAELRDTAAVKRVKHADAW